MTTMQMLRIFRQIREREDMKKFLSAVKEHKISHTISEKNKTILDDIFQKYKII